MFNTLTSLTSSGLSWLKILTGISKSLDIAREILPIYHQMKPIISKVPVLLGKLSSREPIIPSIKANLQSEFILPNNQAKTPNSPSFFQ